MEELQSSDLGAVGLLDRLGQWGVPVPHDISVTGCDNVSVSRLASPKLSTVNSRVQMGRARVDLLLNSARRMGRRPIRPGDANRAGHGRAHTTCRTKRAPAGIPVGGALFDL